MYQRYYDGYPTSTYVPPDLVRDVEPEPEPQKDETPTLKEIGSDSLSVASSGESSNCTDHEIAGAGLLSGFQLDDIILIGLLIFLLAESSDDIVLPLIIGYIFLADKLPI